MQSSVGLIRQVSQWLVSAFGYALILLFLWMMHSERQNRPEVVQVISNLADAEKVEEFKDRIDNFRVDDDIKLDSMLPTDKVATRIATVGVGSGAPGGDGGTGGSGGTGGAAGILDASGGAVASAVVAEKLGSRVVRPLSNTGVSGPLGGEVKGILGSSVQTGGDAGSVDHITVEILRQLEKSKVLVIWLMDATLSLEKRRKVTIDRFDRVYKELKSLDQDRDEALLTSVVAFGQRVIFMTPQPTADQAAVKQAVRNIKNDESGIENIYTAIRTSFEKTRAFRSKGRRKVIMILLTDEIGRDINQLDDTVDLVRRNQVPVYVLGPMAPFGRREVPITWVDEPTGEAFELKVRRGPETCQTEHLALPYWSSGQQFDLFPSGFGPYGLTRLARESGGIFFIFDDNLIRGPKFSVYDLLEYTPDYQGTAEYVRTMSKHPLRVAVIKAVEESKGAMGSPPVRFPTENLANQLRQAQEVAAKTELFVKRAYSELESVEKLRPKETSKRWQAHYDLMMGRLLSAKVRAAEYNWTLAQMRTNPKSIKDPKKNAWELVPDEQIAYGKKETPDKVKSQTNVRRSDAKATEKAKVEADKANTYLKSVVDQHAGTPWAMMAQRELDTPPGFKWQEIFIVPPLRNNQPPTADQKAEIDRQKRRAEALKRAPKL